MAERTSDPSSVLNVRCLANLLLPLPKLSGFSGPVVLQCVRERWHGGAHESFVPSTGYNIYSWKAALVEDGDGHKP